MNKYTVYAEHLKLLLGELTIRSNDPVFLREILNDYGVLLFELNKTEEEINRKIDLFMSDKDNVKSMIDFLSYKEEFVLCKWLQGYLEEIDNC